MIEQEKALNLCHTCPKLCRSTCPVADAEQDEATTPWGKMSTLKMVGERKLPMNLETMGLAYKCLNCRASQSNCEMDNPVSSVLDTFRIRAFRTGLTPGGIAPYCDRFQSHNNPFEQNLIGVLDKDFHDLLPKKKIAYFPGCTEIAHSPETIRKTFNLLHRIGEKEISLYPEPIQCCGYPLFAAGDWDHFIELAEINSHALRDYRMIISGSPACLYTMETLYRSAGHPVSAKFVHITEYLHQPHRLEKIKTKRKHPPVAYHDPCYLGRYRNTYEAPRALIQRISGSSSKEFFRNRESGYCCGAGGLLPVSYPETAKKITMNRLEEFRLTGAEILVSSCPSCVQRLDKIQKETGAGGKDIRVMNLIDYLVEDEF